MQNVYREPFVFACAMNARSFYMSGDGTKPLQFLHVEDLCKIIEQIVEIHPKDCILTVGNKELVTIEQFVVLYCQVVVAPLHKIYIDKK